MKPLSSRGGARRARMSMRSLMITPPRSRRRSWRQISSAASMLVWKALVSASRACAAFAAVDVDGDQRLGLVDDQRAAAEAGAPRGRGSARSAARCRRRGRWAPGRGTRAALFVARGATILRNLLSRLNAASLSTTIALMSGREHVAERADEQIALGVEQARLAAGASCASPCPSTGA